MVDTLLFSGSTLALTNDIVLSLALGLIITAYILHSGINAIVMVALSLYISLALQQKVFFQFPQIAGVSGEVVMFTLLLVATMIIIHQTSLSKALHYSKQAKGKNVLFGFATTGLLLVNIVPYVSLLNTPYSRFLRQSLFGQEAIQFLWTIAPLIILPMLVKSKKK